MADLARIKRNVAKMAAQNAPEEDIDGYIASEGVTVDDVRNFKSTGGKAPIQSPPGPELSVAEDVAKASGAGGARGAADLLGLPGTVGGYLEAGLDFAKAKAYEAVTGDKPEPGSFFAQEPLPNPLSGDSLKEAMSSATGGATDYKGKTTAGKYAGTVAEFAPSAAAGPGGIIRKAAMAVVPGVASEAAGQATEGTALEPYARLGGAILGGGVAAGRAPTTAKIAAKGAPSGETLKNVTNNAYKTLRDVGIQYDANAFGMTVQSAASDLVKRGFRKSNAGTAYSLVDDLAKEVGQAKDFDDINALVSSIGETARDLVKQGKNHEAEAVGIIRERLMQLEESAPLTSRIPLDRARLNEVRGKVREVAFRNIKERALNEIVQNADTYQSGVESGIRNGISNLLRSKRGQQMFKGEERKALLEVAQGRKGLRTLSRFGFDLSRLSGNATALPFAGAAAAGLGIGPIAGAGLAAAGTVAKAASPFFTGRALEQAKAAIRSGKLRDNSALDAAKAERLRIQIRRLLAAESGAQASQPSAPGT